jgi:hypothetical protein
MADIPDAVRALERDLRSVFGDRLKSMLAFGVSAGARTDAHAAHGDGAGLVHTLVVVDAIGEEDLRACAARARAWHDHALATPLIVGAGELARSLDVFPLEFAAIQADHILVAGSNPFEGATIDPADVRRACEVQARSHLLHLREGYIETLGRGDALAVLIVQSAPAFAALLQSVARLQTGAQADAAAAGRHVERLLGTPGGSITRVVKLAGVTEISGAEAQQIFPAYLDVVQRLVTYVDGWSGR